MRISATLSIVLAAVLLTGCGGNPSAAVPASGDGANAATSAALPSAPLVDDASPTRTLDAGPVTRPPLCKSADAKGALVATLDDKPMKAGTAFAKIDGDDIEVTVANYPLSCEEILSGWHDRKTDDDVRITLLMGPHLTPEGCLGWAIHDTSFLGTGSSAQDGGSPVSGAADASAGGKAKLGVDVELESMEPARKAKLSGALDVVGCGAPKDVGSADPPMPGQAGAHIVIAGQRLPIAGAAFVQGKYGRSLVVGSGKVECIEGSGSISQKSFIASSRSPVVVALEWKPTGDDVSRGALEGEWMGHGASTSSWDGGRLTASPSTAPVGAKTMTIDLGGKAKVGDYGVSLEGHVVANVCP